MLTLLVLSSLLTTPTPVEHGQRDHGKLIDAKACNASEAQRTATIATSGIDGKGVVYFGVDYTYNAATAVRMTCTTELPSSTNDYVLQTCSSVADGVCDSDDAVFEKAVSGNKKWAWRVDALGSVNISCVFSCVGGGSSDTFTVYARSSSL